MSDTRLEEAVNTVARWILHNLTIDVIEEGWEDYPELGFHDWDRVTARMDEITDGSTLIEFEAAYDFLASRAEGATP